MQLLKNLKIFSWLPAAVMLPGFRCVTPLYVRFAAQLQRFNYKLFAKCLLVLCSIVITQTIHAQTSDTTYSDTTLVDTVSMQHIDQATVGYDDNDDGYVDTTVQHLYDTSQYFFNWKQDSNEVFANEKIVQRHVIDEDVKQLKTQEDFWYVPTIEKLETRLKNDPKFRDSLLAIKNHELTDEDDNSFVVHSWVQTLIWIIIVGIFLAAVIYFLLQNKISIFSKESASGEAEGDYADDEDIFHLSYTKLIQQSEKEKNYRVAVRLMYLQVLKLLSDTNRIQYQPDYTDLHYLQQLHQSKLYDEFFKVMRSYEYVWYGKFDISNERYTAIKNDFTRLQNKIN